MTTSIKELYPNVTSITVEDPILRTQAKLGEGPIWEARNQTLHFLDILKSRLYHYDPNTGKLEMEQLDEYIGCLAIREKGGLACVAKRGFALLNTDSWGPSKIEYLALPMNEEYTEHSRFNDGAVDPKGIFWCGNTSFHGEDGKQRNGQLYRFDPKTNEAVMFDDKEIDCSNGLGWSPDKKTMYFTSTFINVIYAYDYDVETSTASNRRVFIDGEKLGLKMDPYGWPDGFCIDKYGCIWTARWQGSRILRFTPDGKSIDFEILVPKAYCVSACCFGGPNMDILYITTASPYCCGDLSEEEQAATLKRLPCSGDVFMVGIGNLPKDLVDGHKGVPIGPGVGNYEWRHNYLY